MERLTIPDVKIDEKATSRAFIDGKAVRENAMEFYWRLKKIEDILGDDYDLDRLREQVEKVFPGCRSCKSCRSCVFSIHAIKDMPCKKCDPNAECVVTEYKPSNFCPVCGKPLTDEAVEMVMERMEKLYE